MIARIIKDEVCYLPKPKAKEETQTEAFIILLLRETESNNCL